MEIPMTIPKRIPKIFIDANIVIGAGKPPGGPEIAQVVDLVDAGLVTVLTTDFTVTEVSKKLIQNDFDMIKEIGRPHFRKIIEEATGVALPDLTRLQVRQTLKAKHESAAVAMFEALKARMLAIDNVKPSVVFEAYAAGEGFFVDDGKKGQFPDAFTFECFKERGVGEGTGDHHLQ